DLHVLLTQRTHHVSGGEVARRQFDRIQPQPHRIFGLAENDDVAYAFQPLQGIADIYVEGVADEQVVVAVIVRVKAEGGYKLAGVLVDPHACGLNLPRQAAQHGGSAVLHVDGGNVQTAVQIKNNVDSAGAAVAAGGGYVAHALGAVDRLFEQGGHAGLHSA